MSLRVSSNRRSVQLKEVDYYAYRQLDDIQRAIRIIKLLPGDLSDKICMQIFQHTLTAATEQLEANVSPTVNQYVLSEEWKAYLTVEGNCIFCKEDNGVKSTSWMHPTTKVDHSATQEPFNQVQDISEFDALSYAWGPQDQVEEVNVISATGTPTSALSTNSDQVEGLLLVGKNLASALRHVRVKDRPRYLWVDALSINQDDHAEREAQVHIMKYIYKLARRVIVWLGPEQAGSTLAMSELECLGTEVELTTNGIILPSPGATQNSWFDGSTDLPYRAETWTAIRDLLGREWFQRLWVIQEVALANHLAVIQCGKYCMRFNLFRRAVACLYGKATLPGGGLRQKVLEAVRISEDHRGKTLMSILENSRRQKCLDQKDRVYGILGIAPPKFADRIHAEYSENATVEDVYLDIFISHLNHVGRWELHACELSDRKIKGPSWVPDWTSLEVPGWGSRQQYSTGHSRIHFKYHFPDKLEVTGLQVAEISWVGDAVASGDPEVDLKIARSWESETLLDGNYITGESAIEAYAITLLQYRIRDRWPNNKYMPLLSEWMSQSNLPPLFGENAHSQQSGEKFDRSNFLSHRAYNCVLRRRFVTTSEGYFGLAPISSRPGDIIAVFLGCDPPVVLRPQQNSTYQLVGYCFMYGLTDAAALLGPLPQPWRVQLARHPKSMFREIYQFRNTTTGEITTEDPRLAPNPVWKRVQMEDITRDLDADDPAICDFFENKQTGQVVDYDPRLCEGALKARGIPLRQFLLV